MQIMLSLFKVFGPRATRAILGVGLSALIGLASVDVQAAAVGTVSKVQLTAYGMPPEGRKTEKTLADGVVMHETLETVSDGGLQVSLIDDTTLTLGGGASLVVDEMVYDPATKNGNSVLKLATGTFLYVSGSMNKKGIKIVTPSSTIGVRGTKLLIKIAADGATSVGVIEGAADVQSLVDGSVVSIEPGDSAVAPAAGGVEMASLAAIEVQDTFIAAIAVAEAQESIAQVRTTLNAQIKGLEQDAASASGPAKEAIEAELNALTTELSTSLEAAESVLGIVEKQALAVTAPLPAPADLIGAALTPAITTPAAAAAAATVASEAATGAAREAASTAATIAATTAATETAAQAAVEAAARAAVEAAADAAAQAAAVAVTEAAGDAAAQAAAAAAADAAAQAAAQAAADAAATAAAQAAADAATAAAAQAAADAAAQAAADAAAAAAADAAAQAAADAAAAAAAEAAAQAAADAAAAAAADAAAQAAADAAAAAAADAAAQAAADAAAAAAAEAAAQAAADAAAAAAILAAAEAAAQAAIEAAAAAAAAAAAGLL
ncbi:FecR domain-containing protein [bacterium SCSIO 12827]|nr:FecR domain-containing protein [bacterium SCSIO 12827]